MMFIVILLCYGSADGVVHWKVVLHELMFEVRLLCCVSAETVAGHFAGQSPDAFNLLLTKERNRSTPALSTSSECRAVTEAGEAVLPRSSEVENIPEMIKGDSETATQKRFAAH